MGKLKVHELAKKIGVQNSEMIEKLNKMGIEVKSHLTILDEEIVNRVLGTTKKSEAPKQEQIHIIRRNVRVINTNGDTKEVEQITTNIAGDVKKSHLVESKDINNAKKVSDNSKTNGNSNKKNSNRGVNRRPKFGNNRNTNIVITRNGKPIEKQEICFPNLTVIIN